MSSDKKWKDALLSSGLPLEATVAACLERHGAHVFGEYEFPTVNLDGDQLLRSVDLHAYWDLPAADLNVAVECKYRRDGVCWFFMPPKLAKLRATDWLTNCFVSPFVPPWYCPTVITPPTVKFGHHPSKDGFVFPVVSKGVEIIPGRQGTDKEDAANETAIRNALVQVRYGSASMMFGFPPLPIDSLPSYLNQRFRFIVPMVVTTAELLVFREGVGVSEVRSADLPSDLAISVPALIQDVDAPDQLLGRHIKMSLAENYSALLQSPVTRADAEKAKERMFGPVPPGHSPYADLLTFDGPKRVIVVRMDHLDALLKNIRALLTEPDMLQKYDWLGRSGPDGLVYDVDQHRAQHKPCNSQAAHRGGGPSEPPGSAAQVTQ